MICGSRESSAHVGPPELLFVLLVVVLTRRTILGWQDEMLLWVRQMDWCLATNWITDEDWSQSPGERLVHLGLLISNCADERRVDCVQGRAFGQPELILLDWLLGG